MIRRHKFNKDSRSLQLFMGPFLLQQLVTFIDPELTPQVAVGFRVQGSGFRVQGSGFRVQSSGFRVQGSGSRVQGSGFRAQVSGFRVQGVQGYLAHKKRPPPRTLQ